MPGLKILMYRQENLLMNAFSNHFKGKIFTHVNWFVKMMKNFPLEKKPTIWYSCT